MKRILLVMFLFQSIILVKQAMAVIEWQDLSRVLFQRENVSGKPGNLTLSYLETYSTNYGGVNLQAKTGLECHAGMDFSASVGTEVFSPVSGIVRYSSGGRISIYVNDNSVTEGGYTFIFMHLSERGVNVGDIIHAGELIGKSGDENGEYVPHLHIEIQRGDREQCCSCSNNSECPFGVWPNPTSCEIIENATYNPLEVIKSIVFIRDTNHQLNSDTVRQNGEVIIKGLNFGDTEGEVIVYVDLSLNPEFYCLVDPPLIYYNAINITNWSNTEIRATIFPHIGLKCFRLLNVNVENLREPILIKVRKSNADETNVMPFPFKDIRDFRIVSNNRWYSRFVTKAWKEGVVVGYSKTFPDETVAKSNNLFGPGNPVLRCEILKMVILASGRNVEANPICTCTGVNNTEWPYPFICRALQLGWITTQSDCPFNQYENATRGFVAYLIAKARGMDSQYSVRSEPFADVPESHQYYLHIMYCKDNNIFAGYPDGNFRPEQPINRAEAAKVTMVAFE